MTGKINVACHSVTGMRLSTLLQLALSFTFHREGPTPTEKLTPVTGKRRHKFQDGNRLCPVQSSQMRQNSAVFLGRHQFCSLYRIRKLEGKLRHLCRQRITCKLERNVDIWLVLHDLPHTVHVLIFFNRFQLAASVSLGRNEASVKHQTTLTHVVFEPCLFLLTPATHASVDTWKALKILTREMDAQFLQLSLKRHQCRERTHQNDFLSPLQHCLRSAL